MPRRTIKRPPRSKVETLNHQTPDVTTCLWPGCDSQSMKPMRNKHTGGIIRLRVGILCFAHADAVADAVLEDRLLVADFMQHEVTHEHFDALRREDDKARRSKQQAAVTEKLRGDQPGFVYYLQVGDLIKVGYSVNVKRRMRAYPPGSQLLAVEPGSTDLEGQRHRQFAGSLLDGREWFRADGVLLEHIEHVVQVHGDPRAFRHHYRSNRGRIRQVDRS